MRGTVKVYQGYTDKLILEEPNMIVDGFKEHIVDMMTWNPAPSSVSGDTERTFDASNFMAAAMSVAPSRGSLERKNSLLSVSGYTLTGGGTFGLAPLEKYNESWTYAKPIPNYLFSSVNSVSATEFKNSILRNPTLSAYEGYLTNSKFRDYSIDLSLTGSFVNEILGLYELDSWDILSYLRFAPSGTEYDDTYKAASVSRSDFSSVSGLYTGLSSHVEPDDGVLYIRSWQLSSDADSSSLAALSQTFALNTDKYTPLADIASATLVAEVTCQFSAVSGAANASIQVSLEDVTDGESYHFSGDGSYNRHSWGGAGTPLVRGSLTANTSGTISTFFNIPNDKIGNTFKVSYKFYTSNDTLPLGVYFWNPEVAQPEGWYFGNIHEDSDIHRVVSDDYENPGLYFAASGAGSIPYDIALSDVTYVSQNAQLKPLKKYSFSPMLSGSWAASSNFGWAGVVKWSPSNVREKGKFNSLCETSGGKYLSETRLNDALGGGTYPLGRYAIKPTISPFRTLTDAEVYREKVVPSDLCLELQGTRGGLFPARQAIPFRLKFKSLHTHENGLSAGNVQVLLRSGKKDSDGEFRYYNFTTGQWTVSSAGVALDTSTLSAGPGEYFEYSSPEIYLDPLIGVTTDTSDTSANLALLFIGASGNHGYVKEIRTDTLAPSGLKPEIHRFLKEPDNDTGNPSYSFLQRDVTRDGIFSGLDASSVLPIRLNWSNVASTRNVDGMFASSATCTDAGAEYEFFLMNTNTNSAGDYVKVRATLNDSALIVADEEIEDDILTSEDYMNTPRFDIVGQPFFSFADSAALYPNLGATQLFTKGVGAGVNFIPVSANPDWHLMGGVGMGYPFDTLGFLDPMGKLGYVYNTSDLELPEGCSQMGFSFEYTMLGSTPSGCAWQAAGLTKQGDVVWWDGSSWDYYDISAQPFNSFDHDLSTGATNTIGGITYKLEHTAFTPKITVTTDSLEKIAFYIVYKGNPVLTGSLSQLNTMFIRNWRFYTVHPYDDEAEFYSGLAEFPTPQDRTLQTPIEHIAPLGQYSNNLESYDVLSSLGLEDIYGMASWAGDEKNSPFHSSPYNVTNCAFGMFLSGIGGLTNSSSLEKTSCRLNDNEMVNTDGFILYSRTGKDTNINRKGFTMTPTASSIVYEIDFEYATKVGTAPSDRPRTREGAYFERQGGIAAIGLWTVDLPATYEKYRAKGYPAYPLVDADGSPFVGDPGRNAVYKLIAKKVFRGSLSSHKTIGGVNSGTFIRIKWEIVFL
jgi:hypothetical protein